MKKDVIINVRTSDSAILNDGKVIGISGENYQGNLIFSLDKPIEATGTILINKDGTNYQVAATSANSNTEYYIPILNSLLVSSGKIYLQLRLTEQSVVDGQTVHIPVFLSEIATAIIPSSIDVAIGILEEYPDISTVVDELRGEVATLDTHVGELSGDVSALDTRLDTAEDDIVSLKSRVGTNENDISSLKNRMTTAEGDIDSLEGRMSSAEGNISDLQSDMRTAKDNISTLQSKVSTLEDKVQTLENKVSTLENKVQTIESYDYIIVEGV